MKSTTVSSVVSKGASPKASTDQVDSKLMNGKTFKKSLPSTPKKTNKRGELKLNSKIQFKSTSLKVYFLVMIHYVNVMVKMVTFINNCFRCLF